MQYGFFKLSLNKNQNYSERIIAKYIGSILKFKLKNSLVKGWFKIQSHSLRRRGIADFIKMIKNMDHDHFEQKDIDILKAHFLLNSTALHIKSPTHKHSKIASHEKVSQSSNVSIEADIKQSASSSKASIKRKLDFGEKS